MPTFVEPHTALDQFLDHVMRHGPSLDMLDNELHLRVIREASILLVETKVRRVEMYREGGCATLVLSEDITCSFNYHNVSAPAHHTQI